MAIRRAAVELLAKDMDWNGSDSDSERFLLDLSEAIDRVWKEVRESHKDGLCYDCVTALAGELNNGK